MHLEILVEDISGKKALDILVPKLMNAESTFRVHAYKGIGHIPTHMRDTRNAAKRILLENLPKLLKGYGKTFAGYPQASRAAVVVVCDLDDKLLLDFLGELNGILAACHPAPEARFCLAIEEGEAWLLGDLQAVRDAYPIAKQEVLQGYVNDSICGTWELLADAVYAGGARMLSAKGYQAVGAEKSRWAENIAPAMRIEQNDSPSFVFFRETLRSLAQQG